MKKLSVILVIVILASATGIGVLISQNNQANSNIKALEAQLHEAQRALDTASDEAKANEDKLTSQVEALTTQLETAKADFSRLKQKPKIKRIV